MKKFVDILQTDFSTLRYKDIEAIQILSGQISLKVRYGTGMKDNNFIQEGEVLDENICVLFGQHDHKLFFRSTDGLLKDYIIELIQNKYDYFTSNGSCAKPLYTAPSGYISAGNTDGIEVYTYRVEHILSDTVVLPSNLYVMSNNGGVPILARNIQVLLYDDTYIEFKANALTILELINICRTKFDEIQSSRPKRESWGIYTRSDTQRVKGKFNTSLKGLVFRLVDLLSGDAYLPLYRENDQYNIADDIVIVVGDSHYSFSKDTGMNKLWSTWSNISDDTTCAHNLVNGLCEYDISALMHQQVELPSARGLVLNKRVIVHFTDEDLLCYDINYPIQAILLHLHRLYRGNDPLKHNYKFIHTKTKKLVKVSKVYKNYDLFSQDYDKLVTDNVALLIGPTIIPVTIPSGTKKSKVDKMYIEAQQQFNLIRKREQSKYRMWART